MRGPIRSARESTLKYQLPRSKTNGKSARNDDGGFTFTNPAIESAFKRAIKKYPNAFRRLTD